MRRFTVILYMVAMIALADAQMANIMRGQESTTYTQLTFGGSPLVLRLGTTWYTRASSTAAWASQGTSDLCSDEITIWGPNKARHVWRLTLWERLRARAVADGDFTALIYTRPFVPNSPGTLWEYTRKGQNVATDEVTPRDTIAFGDPDVTTQFTRWGTFNVIGGNAKVCLSRSASASDSVFREYLLEGQ